jgi:hypothetical protein
VGADAARERVRELSDFAARGQRRSRRRCACPTTSRRATRLEELAERAGADPDALGRLLRYLVARGNFAEENGAYANEFGVLAGSVGLKVRSSLPPATGCSFIELGL